MRPPAETRFRLIAAARLLFLIACMAAAAPARAADDEPIAYVGHGAMFDRGGSEIAPSLDFVRNAQAWYQSKLFRALSKADRAHYETFAAKLNAGLALDPQSSLVVEAQRLAWLVEHAGSAASDRLIGKVRLLNQALRSKLPERAAGDSAAGEVPFAIPEALQARLKEVRATMGRSTRLLVTGTGGQAYRDLCVAHGVPEPPDFGPGTPWVARAVPGNPDGIIERADLFIVKGLRAQVLTFQSTAPAGMCVALPRFDSGNQVQADGVICFGQSDPLDPSRAKACFWDNQLPGVPIPVSPADPPATFTFTRGAVQPIGGFAGGSDLRGGVGGVCSDCHAGENPYIVHGPVLGSLGTATGSLPALPTFASSWYDPIVRSGDGGWPENPGPMNAPPTCTGCHGSLGSAGFAGRLPHLSTALGGYCRSVLRSALGAGGPVAPGALNIPPAMPPAAPGSLACTPNVPAGDPRRVACTAATTAVCTPNYGAMDPRRSDPAFPARYEVRCTPELVSLLDWCGSAASGDASTRGDPHVTTADRVRYDFQGAGEFIYLRDGAGLEVQTRQTPVATAAPVGPDPHTGLTTCVSLNTAVAARVAGRRVTFQPDRKGDGERNRLVLRVDGKPVSLAAAGLDLGGGGRITSSSSGGGIEIDFPDKSHLTATPGLWGPPNNVWYLNVDVVGTPAREGIMGTLASRSWLPLLPDWTSLGRRPTSLHRRYLALNRTFADAWRVTDATSLFDYAPGETTEAFADRNWPPEKPPCTIPGSLIPPAQPIDPEKAKAICAEIVDKGMKAQCVFDVSATGEAGFARTYLLNQQLNRRRTAIPR